MSVQQIGQSFLYAKAPHTLGGVAALAFPAHPERTQTCAATSLRTLESAGIYTQP